MSVTGDERAAGSGGDEAAGSTDQGAGPFDRVYSERSRRVAAWARGERPGGLTERELEVLRLVAEGLSNKEIAQRLQMTRRTVEFHVSNILKKLGVTSRVEAAMWAREQGVIS